MFSAHDAPILSFELFIVEVNLKLINKLRAGAQQKVAAATNACTLISALLWG